MITDRSRKAKTTWAILIPHEPPIAPHTKRPNRHAFDATLALGEKKSEHLQVTSQVYISSPTIDDLMRRVFSGLLKSNNRVNPTKGRNVEWTGVLLRLRKPRARLSRTETRGKPYSCLGELLWYLAKTDDLEFIKYYITDYRRFSDDGKTIFGAYGPRMFNIDGNNQVANVIKLLKQKPQSRQAVIQLFQASDILEAHKDVPCTCTLQFMIRKKTLHMFTNMRSNDAFLGLPHDIFAFTMLQEIIARTLNVELGSYKHAVGSLHLYDKDREQARKYLQEGWQSTILMPKMPIGDPWPSISLLQKAEADLRCGREITIADLKLEPYWQDLVRLLQIYSYKKRNKRKQIACIKAEMSLRFYDPYIR